MSITTRDIVSHTLYSTSAVDVVGFNSSAINRDSIDGYCVLAAITVNTTTSSVVLNLAASLDNVVYVDVSDSTATVSSTSNIMWNVSDSFYPYVRVEATLTTANINTTITARSIRK